MTEKHLSPESARQAAFANMPDKYRRQHGQFDYSGLDRGEIPTATAMENTQISHMLANGSITLVQHSCAKRLHGYREVALQASSVKINPIYGDILSGDSQDTPVGEFEGLDCIWFIIAKKMPRDAMATICHVVIDDHPTNTTHTMRALRDALDLAEDAIWDAKKTLDMLNGIR